MSRHRTGTPEEHLVARLELLEAEKELTQRSDELARRRQALPWVPIEKEYVFDTEDGEQRGGDLGSRARGREHRRGAALHCGLGDTRHAHRIRPGDVSRLALFRRRRRTRRGGESRQTASAGRPPDDPVGRDRGVGRRR